MFVTTPEESGFILNQIKKTDVILEYGCGSSTLEFAKLAHHVISIEHNKEWAEKISSHNVENIEIIYVEVDITVHPPHDGDKDDFHAYINAPLKLHSPEAFDIIYIDGRARPWCAQIAPLFCHKGTKIFIHDYNTGDPTRESYKMAENWLDVVAHQDTLYQFEVKKNG